MLCRKNFIDLTPPELDRLADALNELYDDGLITDFANLHRDAWDHIHWEPQFLPWHRHFLLRFENALRAIDDRVTLPFWDWTRADSQDLDTGVWGTFFGGRGNSGGRFDEWDDGDLTRASSPVGDLPTVAEVGAALDAGSFTAFREGVEPGEVHVAAHRWVGEDMFSDQSPRDPLFYLHHCNLDRIWAVWQLNNQALDQYDTTAIPSDGNSPGSPDGLTDSMVGGATPQSMLDHRALGIRYPVDDGVAAIRPDMITGDPVGVELVTNIVWFNDIPEDEETRRPATFVVEGCERLNFEVTAGPTAPFVLHDGGFVSHPQTDLHTDEVRIWVRYQGTTVGSTDSGLMTVLVTDEDGNQIEEFVDIPLEANTVERPKAAVVMVLDESGSMLADAGNNRTRLEVLQRAALTFVDNLFDDNGFALVSFDETATKLTELAEAGGMTSSARNAARQAIHAHGPPNRQPHTSIGAGIEEASDLYVDAPDAGDYAVKATLVFTDGVQDREPWISQVSAAVSGRVYAVGVANAANVANDVLQQLASGSGGMMLVTGAIDADDEFLLEKFFIQILAGVVNGSMVTDPAGVMRFGEIETENFLITRADIGFDALILTRYPGAVLAALIAPDGTLILAQHLPPGSLRVGSSSVDFRVSLPVVHEGVEHWAGDWKLVMTLGWGGQMRTTAGGSSEVFGSAQLPYHALVHARSNLRMIVALDQDGLDPGSSFTLTANINEYGWPIESHPLVRAIARRPDGSSVTIQFAETETGRYVTSFVGATAGAYLFRIMAEGYTTAGEAFTREQLLTGVLGRPVVPPPENPTGSSVGDGVRDAICDFVECFGESLSPGLRKRMAAAGVDIEALEKCLCRPRSAASRAEIADLLAEPRAMAVLRDALSDLSFRR